MADPQWLMVFCFLAWVRSATSQQTGAPADTNRQFAAFVGGRPNIQAIGASFQIARMPALNIQRSNLPAEMTGMQGICENITYNCNSRYPYRTADGSCNNLNNPTWGKAIIPMRRWIPPVYNDGVSTPRTKGKFGQDLPSARFVSTTIHGTQDIDIIPKENRISHMVMQWGHFLDHDITHAPPFTGESTPDCCSVNRAWSGSERSFPCFPIRIPPNDPFFKDKTCLNFVRSIQVPNADCTMTPVEQMNAITAFVDASNVYGSGDKEDLRLKRDGLLKVGDNNLLPSNGDSADVCDARCFDAGDVRRNEQMGLTSMHTLFMREHNRIARTLKKYNPHWGDEKLFQESKKIVGAITQEITFCHWLPIILDPVTRQENQLNSFGTPYENIYDPNVDPSIRNVFGAAAFRFGHTLVRSAFSRRNTDYSINTAHQTSDIFGKTSIIKNSRGQAVEQFLRGLVIDRVAKLDRFITPELTNLLFKSGNDSLDLAALNIQRGRDQGIPPYNAWREWCGLPKANFFNNGYGGFTDHSSKSVQQLARAYRGFSTDDVDLFPAGISERPVNGGLLGPTFACLVGRQFGNLKKGDRFWYKRQGRYTGFTPDRYSTRNPENVQ